MKNVMRFCLIVSMIIDNFYLFTNDRSNGLHHMCAYSNESVVKFRDKILQRNIVSYPGFAFEWPIDLCEFWISSLYGMRNNNSGRKMHNGVDMAALKGTKILAAADGVVIQVAQGVSGYGNMIEIEHKGNFITRYAHLYQMNVERGQRVKRGDLIGTVGASGNVRGKKDPSHLHFEILKEGKFVDPLLYLYASEIGFKKS